MKKAPALQVPSLRWVYLACVVIGSIGAHLVSEFAAMGSDAEKLSVSPRHLYLLVAALAALLFAVREVRQLRASSSGGRDFKRKIELGLASLPFSGTGRFWMATAGLQLAIGAITEIGEGCPLCGHDVAAGIGGAVIGALVLSLLARAMSQRLPSIASAFVEFVPASALAAGKVRTAIVAVPIVLSEFLWFARLFNRPPPALQS
jgi:hypothetical protein